MQAGSITFPATTTSTLLATTSQLQARLDVCGRPQQREPQADCGCQPARSSPFIPQASSALHFRRQRADVVAPRPPGQPAMAVIDQDNFSNVSWSSDRPAGASSSGGGAAQEALDPGYGDSREPPQEQQQQQQQAPVPSFDRLDTAGLGSETLECTVSSPLAENEGTRDQFISYLVTTNVCAAEMCSARPPCSTWCSLTLTLPYPTRSPPSHLSRSPRSRSAAASPTSSSSTRRSAATSRRARCRRSRTSSG